MSPDTDNKNAAKLFRAFEPCLADLAIALEAKFEIPAAAALVVARRALRKYCEREARSLFDNWTQLEKLSPDQIGAHLEAIAAAFAGTRDGASER
jgi:hypothetical protein